jgi:phosphotriesterase-related protein
MKHIYTTAGALAFSDFSLALPHEHIFTETGEAPAWAYRDADFGDVKRIMKPHLLKAKERGVNLICEATPEGVGRRADIVTMAARESGMPVAIATGFYREPWITKQTYDAGVAELAGHMTCELNGNIEGTDVRAGFIKLGTSDDGMTVCEEKLLRAACRATLMTGAAICSHTVNGQVADRALNILEEEGVEPSRYVWFHASSERDYQLLKRVSGRGAYLCIDYRPDTTLTLVQRLLKDGLNHQILMSMDSGWYNPRFAGGGDVHGYTGMLDDLFPKLEAAGIDEQTIRTVTHDNVFEAYAR